MPPDGVVKAPNFNTSIIYGVLYFCMDVKHRLLQVKFDVKYKLLLIDVLGTS
jgi:hypothetical protein